MMTRRIVLAFVLFIVPEAYLIGGGCITSDLTFSTEGIDYCSGETCVTFSGLGTGLHGNESFCWDFGDGSQPTCETPGLTGAAWYTRTVCRSFDLNRKYTVTLTVTPAHTQCVTSYQLSFIGESYILDESCSGNSDGCIYIQPGDGTDSVTYLWSDGSTGRDLCGVARGSYTVTVTDKAGCSISEQYIVGDPDPLSLQVDSIDCANGYARISAYGGTPYIPNQTPYNEDFDSYSTGVKTSHPYQRWTTSYPPGDAAYQWAVFDKQLKGYSLDLEAVWKSACIDIQNCSVNTNYLAISLGKKCHDMQSDDYIRVYSTCNGGPETQILAPSFSEIPYYPNMCRFSAGFPACSGCLNIIIRARRPDPSSGCNIRDVFGPCGTVSSTTTTTGGGINETIVWMDSITVTCTPKSLPPYQFVWCDGTTGAENSNLPPNASCGVTITDGNGCTAFDFVSCCTIGATASATPATCQGNCDGGATVTAGAGTAPFTFSWSDGQTGSVRSGLCAGLYQVIVTDAAGCSTVENVRIEAKVVEPMAQATDTTAICKNSGDSRQLSAGGGVSYSWSPGATLNDSTVSNPVASPTKTTRYFVTVTDASGCTGIGSVTVPVEVCSGLSPDITNLSTLQLFPNPAASAVTVVVGGREAGIRQVTLYNARGRAVAVAPVKGGRSVFDVSALPAGIYYVAAQGGDGFRTAKIAVLH